MYQEVKSYLQRRWWWWWWWWWWWPVLPPGLVIRCVVNRLPTSPPALSLFTLGLTAHWQEEWLDWQLQVPAGLCVCLNPFNRTHISHSSVTGRIFHIFQLQSETGEWGESPGSHFHTERPQISTGWMWMLNKGWRLSAELSGDRKQCVCVTGTPSESLSRAFIRRCVEMSVLLIGTWWTLLS